MNVQQLLAEISRLGIQVVVDEDHLRLRPGSLLNKQLLEQVRSHKSELLQLLGNERPQRVADTLGGLGVADDLSVKVSEVVAMPLEEFAVAGLVIQVRSEVLGASVICASDNAHVDPGEPLVVYRARELRLLLGAGAGDLRTLHSAKKVFGGTLEAN